MKFAKSSECTDEYHIGYSPITYFVIGVAELVWCLSLAVILFQRNYFPSISRSSYVSYILPIYLSFVTPLLFTCFVIGAHSVVGLFVTNIYLLIGKWFVLRCISESLCAFLMHVGIGFRSAFDSFYYGVAWSFFNAGVAAIAYTVWDVDGLIIASVVLLSALLVFYLSMLCIPIERLHRRPALYPFAVVNCLILVGQLGSVLSFMLGPDNSANNCSIESSFSVCEFILTMNVFYAFYRDSLFWQGLYVDSKANLNEPLLGVWDMNHEAVNLVTHSVIELERNVTIIPFAKLRVDTSHFFSGGTARVYKGSHEGREVAIKFLFCMELTPGRILEFCKEAALLNSLQHPNIVKCFGVAIMPPAISLVSEFCTYGSLFDFLHSTDLVLQDENDSHSDSRTRSRSTAKRDRTETRETIDSAGSERRLVISSSKLFKDTNSNNFSKDIEEGSHEEIHHANSNPLHNTNRYSVQYMDRRFTQSSEQNSAHRLELLKYLDPQGSGKADAHDVAGKLADALSNSSSDHVSLTQSYQISSERSSLQSKRITIGSGVQAPWNNNKSVSCQGPISESHQSTRLRSPTAVMMTREMGFGLGPISDMKKVPRDSLSTKKLQELSLNVHNVSHILSACRTSVQVVGNLLPLSIRLQMIRDCCAGLTYLHSQGIMHCDIKSLNFLVTADLTVKLADLGEAIFVQDIDKEKKSFPTNINWSSPETLTMDAKSINEAADVWSLGMVIYEVLSGEVPFDTDEYRALSLPQFLEKLEEGHRPVIPKEYEHLTWLKELVAQSWEYDPRKRTSAAALWETVCHYAR